MPGKSRRDPYILHLIHLSKLESLAERIEIGFVLAFELSDLPVTRFGGLLRAKKSENLLCCGMDMESFEIWGFWERASL